MHQYFLILYKMKNIGSGTSFVWTIFRLWSGSKLWYHPRTFSSSQLCYRPSISVTNKKGAVDVGDFWTISIINKVIKIISKILSERLQPDLRRFVSTKQRTFIKGQSIMESFLVAKELLSFSNKNKIPAIIFKRLIQLICVS